MKLDDPVARYLTARAKVPARNGKEITLLNLAAQDSGLPRFPDNLSDRSLKELTRAELREASRIGRRGKDSGSVSGTLQRLRRREPGDRCHGWRLPAS